MNAILIGHDESKECLTLAVACRKYPAQTNRFAFACFSCFRRAPTLALAYFSLSAPILALPMQSLLFSGGWCAKFLQFRLFLLLY